MKEFKILPHLADLKISVFGKSRKELFENALKAMFSLAGYQGKGKEIKRKIKINSFDFPSLLVDFLNEALSLSEIKKELYLKIKISLLSENSLEGILFGRKLKKRGILIKGVTYHNLEIKKEKGKFKAIILFDI